MRDALVVVEVRLVSLRVLARLRLELLDCWMMVSLMMSTRDLVSTVLPAKVWASTVIVLGGAEATLWDLCGAYASMGRTLLNYQGRIQHQKEAYSTTDFRALHCLLKDSTSTPSKFLEEAPVLNATSIYNTFEIMRQLERPNSEGGWKYFESSRDIAWKTGTSFGFRDAWAIGVTPEYTIGVWVGNATGEGKQGLIGVKTAAPILFDVFNQLPHTSWFAPPKTALVTIPVWGPAQIVVSLVFWIPLHRLQFVEILLFI